VRVQFLATHDHYRDHLRPVYDALPRSVRGRWWSRQPDDPSALTVCSSYGDYRLTTGPVIFTEHGVGFQFSTGHPAYCGGRNKWRVVLFLETNAQTLRLNTDAYPQAVHELVGCPKLDRWVARPPKVRSDPPTVAFSFHWDAHMAPETRSAWPYYRQALEDVTSWGWKVIGHGHPRAWPDLEPWWRSIGVEPVATFDEVVDRADCYVADATSTLYEFAALGRPVVVLNAPWYRREVDHGIRFWRHLPGVTVDRPDGLRAAIGEALAGAGEDRRGKAVEAVYPHLGAATSRAVDAIVRFATGDGPGTLAAMTSTGGAAVQTFRVPHRVYRTTENGSRELLYPEGVEIPVEEAEALGLLPVLRAEPVREPVEDRKRTPASAAKKPTARKKTAAKPRRKAG
jgi:hypothetical protein